MIKIGDHVPEVTLYESTEFGEACPLSPAPVSVTAASKGRRIAIFGLPGAYTPTCSAKHLPGYLTHLSDLKAKGVDEVWCLAVNDGYVMAAWGKEQKAFGKIRMLGDGSGEFAKQTGLEVDLGKFGMGVRMQRFSMLLADGVVKQLNVEGPGKFEVSDAATMLKQVS